MKTAMTVVAVLTVLAATPALAGPKRVRVHRSPATVVVQPTVHPTYYGQFVFGHDPNPNNVYAGNRYVGSDPDPNVRMRLIQDYYMIYR